MSPGIRSTTTAKPSVRRPASVRRSKKNSKKKTKRESGNLGIGESGKLRGRLPDSPIPRFPDCPIPRLSDSKVCDEGEVVRGHQGLAGARHFDAHHFHRALV